MDNIEKIDSLITLENSGAFSFGAITEKKALKKSRITKEPTPEKYARIYKIILATVSLGNDYQNSVNNRLKKEGKETDFESQGTYTESFKNSKIVLKHKHKNLYYVRVYPNLCHSFNTRKEYFDSDGNHLYYRKFKKLEKEYFSLPSVNKSQNLDDQIIVNNYKMENVKWVKRGDFKIQEIPFELLKKMINNLLDQ